jgi:hypothetical protein
MLNTYYSPKIKRIQLIDGSMLKLTPLSFAKLAEFHAMLAELSEYCALVDGIPLGELLATDTVFQQICTDCLAIAGIDSSLLAAHNVAALLFPFEDANGKHHARGILIEQNFDKSVKAQPSADGLMSKEDIEAQYYELANKILSNIGDLNATMQMLEDLPADLARAMLAKPQTSEEKLKMKAKKTLEAMINAN